jgi:hypothetical protein
VQLLVATIAAVKEFRTGNETSPGSPTDRSRERWEAPGSPEVLVYALRREPASSPMSSSSTSLVSRTFASTNTNDSAAKIAYMR